MIGVLAELARTFALLSLVSIGGVNALLPEIHRQVVDIHGWMTDAAFASAFAIANASPGPNVIFVSLIGWQVAGLAGLLVATLALLIPSSALAYFAGRVLTRWSHHPAVAVLRDALIPVALGMMLASGLSMMRTVDRDTVTVLISLAATVFVYTTRRNPLWALGSGAIVNVAALHFS
ncbi:chromate transporter [Reyranella sp.]|uniref:chromate transporter n=1 Tax=Reyranella sp. TaxID=1929291 RepID=UPI003BA98E77